jgi:hypothetical protein
MNEICCPDLRQPLINLHSKEHRDW